MVMDTIQVRLTHKIIEKIDMLVKDGTYSSRSEAVRDGARRIVSVVNDLLIIDKLSGMFPEKGVDSVKEVRKIREKLSKEKFDLDEINKLAD